MKHYVQIKKGIVVNRAIFDGDMPKDWAGKATWIDSEDAQIGWSYSDGVFAPPVPPPLPPPTKDDVKAEADRRLRRTDSTILKALELLLADQLPAGLVKERQTIRSRSDEIESLRDIPADLGDDRHWSD